jgi:hypothetical protein
MEIYKWDFQKMDGKGISFFGKGANKHTMAG